MKFFIASLQSILLAVNFLPAQRCRSRKDLINKNAPLISTTFITFITFSYLKAVKKVIKARLKPLSGALTDLMASANP